MTAHARNINGGAVAPPYEGRKKAFPFGEGGSPQGLTDEGLPSSP